MVHLMSLVLFQSETQIKAVFQMHARKDNSVFQDYLLLIKNGAKETSPDYWGAVNRGSTIAAIIFSLRFS